MTRTVRAKFRRKDDCSQGWVTCPQCVSADGRPKRAYTSKSKAKRARKLTSEKHLSVYKCPHNESWWHVGHLPWVTRVGSATRGEVFGRG